MPEAGRREGALPAAAGADVARILVTCDASPLGVAALDAAVALARGLDIELAGLFVEDSNLLRMAALPFAREYALASAAARRVESGEIQHALQRQADAARNALSRAAHAVSVPWSFQVVRGALLDSVLEAMREPDLAVFGCTGQFVVTPDARAGTHLPRMHAAVPRQPILTIYDESSAAQRALAAARMLAEVHHTSVVLLVIACDEAVMSRLRACAAGQLAGSHVAVRFQNLPSRDTQSIKKAAHGCHAAALLWHGVQTPDERQTLATLVDALKCPVVLVL
jgi:hypothetical protein